MTPYVLVEATALFLKTLRALLNQTVLKNRRLQEGELDMLHDCRRVVVTGLGVISPVGLTVSDMWEALVLSLIHI